jgi:hypothetical protein
VQAAPAALQIARPTSFRPAAGLDRFLVDQLSALSSGSSSIE